MDNVDIGYKIKKINDVLQKRADETMREMDVTFSQHHVLIYLIHCEDHTSTLKTMEKKFKVSQATMAGLVKRLEEKGMVESYSLESDKRIKMVKISDKGKEVCNKSKELIIQSEQRIREIFTSEEIKQFIDYLDRMYKYLDKETSYESVK